jgi:hypothetical protein
MEDKQQQHQGTSEVRLDQVAGVLWIQDQAVAGADLGDPPFQLVASELPELLALRYRLHGIDRIVSRTLAWALLTTVLGLGYAEVVLGPGRLLPQGPSLMVAAARRVHKRAHAAAMLHLVSCCSWKATLVWLQIAKASSSTATATRRISAAGTGAASLTGNRLRWRRSFAVHDCNRGANVCHRVVAAAGGRKAGDRH